MKIIGEIMRQYFIRKLKKNESENNFIIDVTEEAFGAANEN